jgi:ribonuclease PH
MRNYIFETNVQINPYSSVLVKAGNTKVLTALTVLEKTPGHVKEGNGWLTAEYSLMPGSTNFRAGRERKKVSGRTAEIQRLIGRSLRMSVDLTKIHDMTLMIDCDVVDADGGTRTASVNGGMLACAIASKKLVSEGRLNENPLKRWIGAISAGVVNQEVVIDLDYEKDSKADSDFNFVFCENGNIIEVQGTAEKEPVSEEIFLELMERSKECVMDLIREMKITAGYEK